MADHPTDLPFDEAVCEDLRLALMDVMLKHPEVKALAVSIVWAGNLITADIKHGLLATRTGRPKIDDVCGALIQTTRMLDAQVRTAEATIAGMVDRLAVLGQEIVTRNEQAQEHDRHAAAGGGAGGPAAGDRGPAGESQGPGGPGPPG